MMLCKINKACESEPGYGSIITKEISSLNGMATIEAFWVFTDSMQVDSGTLFRLPNGWQLNSHNLKTVGQWYAKGDSVNFSFSFSYDTTLLPYYPKDIELFQNLRYEDGQAFELYFFGKIFFTPWNTLEIFDEHDFYTCGRVWQSNQGGPEPQRVYVPQSSIPSSTFNPNDLLDEDWKEDVQLHHIENVPFAVQMAALHPDTMAKWDTVYYDYVYGPNGATHTRLLIIEP